MKTTEYKAPSGTNIRAAIENASRIARAINSNIIVVFNDARFSVSPKTNIQDAIDTYLEVKNKIYETEKLLKQK